eukprot:gene8796-9700_t
MHAVFRLPNDLCRAILQEWIGELLDLSSFDVACSNREVRSCWLEMLEDLFLPANQYLDNADNLTSYLRWLSSRKVKISHLALRWSSARQLVEEGVHLPTLQAVRFLDEFRRPVYSDKMVRQFFSCFPSLQEVDWREATDLTDGEALRLLALPSLRRLRLGSSRKLSSRAVCSLLEGFAWSLEELYVNGERLSESVYRCFLSRTFPALRRLRIERARHLSVALLLDVCRACRGLEMLELPGYSLVLGQEEALQLAAACPKLRRLELHSLRAINIACLVKSFTSMEWLCVAEACFLKGPGDRRELRLLRLLPKEPYLPLLTPLHCLYARDCSPLGPNALRQIQEQLGLGLQELAVRLGSGVGDEEVCGLVCACSGLHELSFSSCRALTDASLENIALHCTQLRSLILEDGESFSAPALARLVRLLGPRLQSLRLHSCGGVDDALLTVLVDHCPHITALSLCEAEGVTIEGLSALLLARPGWKQVVVDCHLENGLAARLRSEGEVGLRIVSKINMLGLV